jgi:hypothetical protein
MVVFLSGLPSSLGARDATGREIGEVLREGLLNVQVGDALLPNRAIFQDNGNRHVMRPTAFIAKGKDTVLSV